MSIAGLQLFSSGLTIPGRRKPVTMRRAGQGPLEKMLRNYVPILIFLIIAGGLGVVLLGLGFALGRGEKTSEIIAI